MWSIYGEGGGEGGRVGKWEEVRGRSEEPKWEGGKEGGRMEK